MLPISRPEANDEIRERLSLREWWPTLIAGGLSLVVITGLLYLFDEVSPHARAPVLEGLTNSVFWLATAMIGSCATIAALMLTTLTLMEHLDTRRMGPRFLFHLRLTVLAALFTVALAILSLVLTIFPSAGTEDFQPEQWQIDATFYGMVGLTAMMIGSFSMVLSSLYSTIADVFRNLPQRWVEDILAEDDEDTDQVSVAPWEGSGARRSPSPTRKADQPVAD
ncbi:MAG: hypothetical protein M3Q71_24725 [Chloroflexota bacterium]|nr:hypothetical protein [Chloroflexota bacterium]